MGLYHCKYDFIVYIIFISAPESRLSLAYFEFSLRITIHNIILVTQNMKFKRLTIKNHSYQIFESNHGQKYILESHDSYPFFFFFFSKKKKKRKVITL